MEEGKNVISSKLDDRKSNARKKWGLFLLITPFILLVVSLVAFAVVSFSFNAIISTSGSGPTELRDAVRGFINIILSLIGIISVIGIIVGVPIGIFLIASAKGEEENFSIKEAVSFGWSKTLENFWLLAAVVFVIFVANYAYLVISFFVGKKEGLSYLFILLVSYIVFAVISMILYLGAIEIGLKIAKGKEPKFQDLFSQIKKFFSYFVASFLYGLLVLVGILLFIVPGIIWSIKYRFFTYFIVEGEGPINALKKSGQITSGAKAKLFVFGIVLGLISFLGALALLVGVFWTMPLVILADIFVFYKLKERVNF